MSSPGMGGRGRRVQESKPILRAWTFLTLAVPSLWLQTKEAGKELVH